MSSPEFPASGRRQVTVRRAPRFVPFLVLGALLGAAVAAILAYGVPGDEGYDASTVFGFFLVPCAAGGAILGAVVALLLDRLSLRRAQHAVVEAVPDSVPDAGTENDGRLDGGAGNQPRP
jgi:H+/Cl- antiporter ClcA